MAVLPNEGLDAHQGLHAAGESFPGPGHPKGLRHAFAISALQAGVPINFVRKWLGHARLSTTEIYADAVGEEEHAIAERFWGTSTNEQNATFCSLFINTVIIG